MITESSVSTWIASLKAADTDAAQRLWNRYAVQLVELARLKLGNAPKGIADEEDIAQSVFRRICSGAAKGRFQDLKTRDDLWWVVLDITRKRVVDHRRRQGAAKRGGGRVVNETALVAGGRGSEDFSLDQLLCNDPTPDFFVILTEQLSRLMGLLRDDCLRKVAVSRIEGYTTREIAADLAISARSVERKLQLIRATWATELTATNA